MCVVENVQRRIKRLRHARYKMRLENINLTTIRYRIEIDMIEFFLKKMINNIDDIQIN